MTATVRTTNTDLPHDIGSLLMVYERGACSIIGASKT